MRFDYSVAEIEGSQRHAYWHDVVSKHFIPSESWLEADSSIPAARFRGNQIGPLMAAATDAPRRTYNRTERCVRQLPDHDLLAIYISTGMAHMSQVDRSTVLRAGDIALFDAAKPFKHEFLAGSTYSMRIPRTLLQARVPGYESILNVKIAERQPMSAALGHMMRQAAVLMSNAPDSTKSKLASAFLDGLAASIELQTISGNVSDKQSYAAIFDRAVTFIEQNLGDAELTADEIAGAVYVSRRTLSRAFAQNDTTVMHYLWRRRLETSYVLLKEAQVRQINQAAFQCGFNDLSHFCRSFKKQYGVSPGAVIPR
jgi:AraC-like DNA-binding protein